jgi:16S rRNA (guanine966-N2)-methyltransferase
MRIIGGTAGGRHLFLPKGCHARPTSDRIKEALFNILGPLEGIGFLDLFAGSGSVGLEALSRGAAPVVFIEKDATLAAALRRTLEEWGFRDRGRVLQASVRKGLLRLEGAGDPFGVVFLDPPYDAGLVGETLAALVAGGLLAPGGQVVVQHSAREAVPEPATGLPEGLDRRRYGDTALTFIRFPGKDRDDTP